MKILGIARALPPRLLEAREVVERDGDDDPAAGDLQEIPPGQAARAGVFVERVLPHGRLPFGTAAASSTAMTIRRCAPQRQRFPSSSSRISASVGLRVPQQKPVRGDDHPRRAIAALNGIMPGESLLQGMELPVPGQSLDRRDRLSFDVLDGVLAGANGLVADEHGAGAAETLAAAVFRPGEPEFGPQDPEEHALPVHGDARGLAVQRETDGAFHSGPPSPRENYHVPGGMSKPPPGRFSSRSRYANNRAGPGRMTA